MFRVGQGFDVHAFGEGHDLIIGGVKIPFERGLAGHSDADVLLHAISDACLGAAGLGDIGRHFPDTDESYRNADSQQLLRKVNRFLKTKGFEVVNVDSTIIAQTPKMSPYIQTMQTNIANCLEITPPLVNVAATTTEKLGFCGREEAIAAQAIVLLQSNEGA